MSALLDDIIKTAIDGNQSLSMLLRKCLVLAHELRDERLKAWANQELNGYSTAENLPEYRIMRADAHGNFSGPFQSGARNWPIPPIALDENHRAYAEEVFLMQAVSAYEDVATQPEGTIQFPWPGNLVVYYQKRFFEGRFALISAWQEVPKNALVELLDTVRNRTLNMALEIKDELGTSYADLRKIEPSEAAKIQHIIVQNIKGGTNYLAFGQANLNASTNTQTVISVGDRQMLDSILGKSGLDETDLEKLSEAIHSDGDKKPGSRVGSWIRDHAPKIVAGGAKIGVKIGQELLTQWIKQFYGLP